VWRRGDSANSLNHAKHWGAGGGTGKGEKNKLGLNVWPVKEINCGRNRTRPRFKKNAAGQNIKDYKNLGRGGGVETSKRQALNQEAKNTPTLFPKKAGAMEQNLTHFPGKRRSTGGGIVLTSGGIKEGRRRGGYQGGGGRTSGIGGNRRVASTQSHSYHYRTTSCGRESARKNSNYKNLQRTPSGQRGRKTPEIDLTKTHQGGGKK